jgi:hypothetical protein
MGSPFKKQRAKPFILSSRAKRGNPAPFEDSALLPRSRALQ